jgi:hypothetical protein
MASLYGDTNAPRYNPTNYDSALWLQTEPKPRVLGKSVKMRKPGTVHPFVFGTDTSFGLKAAWSGLTAQFPDTVRLGLNRKEFALAPVFVSHSRTNGALTNAVKMPSFLATMDNSSDLSSLQESGVRHVQYFATGLAADHLALQPDVRRAMIQRLDPKGQARAEQFTQFKTSFTAQTDNFARIQSAYTRADVNKRAAIRQKALDLGLLTEPVDDQQFIRTLRRSVDATKPEVTESLNALADFSEQ